MDAKQQIIATFKGTSGEGYDSGIEYVLRKWEENGMVFISRIDGNGQVAYDSMDSLRANWDLKDESKKPLEKTQIKATFLGASGSAGYETGLEYALNKWEENDMVFISLVDGRGQVAYDSMESLKANWKLS